MQLQTSMIFRVSKHGSGLGLLKSTFNAENFTVKDDAGWLGLYLQPFHRNSILKCALHPKIAKNSLKTCSPFIWGGGG